MNLKKFLSAGGPPESIIVCLDIAKKVNHGQGGEPAQAIENPEHLEFESCKTCCTLKYRSSPKTVLKYKSSLLATPRPAKV